MLLRQHGGGHQDGHLLAVLHRFERGAQRDLGLAVADVAAHQPIHRPATQHVGLDVFDGPLLVGRLGVRERLLQLALPGGIGREGEAGRRLARGVDLEQVLGQLGDRTPHPSLGPLPVCAAQPRQSGSRAAGVTGDSPDHVGRQEDLVVTGEVELQVLLGGAAVLALGHPGIARDPMVDVHHGVPDRQLPDQVARHHPLGRGQPPHPGRAEQLSVAEHQQARRAVGESGSQRSMDQPDRARRRRLAQLRLRGHAQATLVEQLANAAGLVGADDHPARCRRQLDQPAANALGPAGQDRSGSVAGVAL